MVLLLLEHIVQLFLCIILGWLLVRVGLVKPTDSRVLSVVCLYLIIPCVIVTAFQIQRTPELLQGMALALGAAIGMVSLFCGVTNCPVASLLIAFELFGFPDAYYFLIAVATSYMLSGYFSLYHAQRIAYSKFENRFIDRQTSNWFY